MAASNMVEVANILTTGGMKWKLIDHTGQIVRYTPAWRTRNGAIRWALKKGYSVKEEDGK